MRVLHLIYDDPGNPWVAGGGAVRVFEIYRRLADRLDSVVVATGKYPGARDVTIEGVRYRRLGVSRPYALSRATYTIAASRLLRTTVYDVAIFDFSTYVPLSVPGGKPIGFTVHHVTGQTAVDRWGPATGRLVRWQEERRLRRCRIFSATSRATERTLRRLLGPGAEIHLVMAGVPDELFEIPRADDGYLLYFGRLDWYQKGLDVLLDALRILADSDPQVRLKVAGRGKDSSRLVEAAGERGLLAHLEMLGPVGDLERNRLLSGASLLIMPSRFEGFGMVAAEAMAAGVPVVASDADSLPEVVDPPRGGRTTPLGDAAALARAVADLLRDPLARERLSTTARDSAERFRWSRVAEEHFEFLRAVQRSHTTKLADDQV